MSWLARAADRAVGGVGQTRAVGTRRWLPPHELRCLGTNIFAVHMRACVRVCVCVFVYWCVCVCIGVCAHSFSIYS